MGVPGNSLTAVVGGTAYLHAHPDDMTAESLIPLRARVRPEIATAFHAEALARRLTPGAFLAQLLADALPAAAAERVRRQVAPARRLEVVDDEVEAEEVPPPRGST